MSNENDCSKAVSFHILSFSIKIIHFPNGIVISRTKRNLSVLTFFIPLDKNYMHNNPLE
jgi:hypothetical protein